MRMVGEDHEIELAPDEFGQPDRGAGALVTRCERHEFPDRNGAETQMHRKIRRPFQCRKIALAGVFRDARREIPDEPLCTRGSGWNGQRAEIRALETKVRQRGYAPIRCRDEMDGVFFHWIGFDEERRQFGEPGVFVRSENRKRLARFREDLIFLEDHLVLARVKFDSLGGKRGGHRRVALDRLRLVIVIGVDSFHAKNAGKAGNRIARRIVQHMKAATCRGQRVPQLPRALPDEFNTPVSPCRQTVEDFLVEHENAVHGRMRFERCIERCVIVGAQVPPEPDQRAIRCYSAQCPPRPGVWPQGGRSG